MARKPRLFANLLVGKRDVRPSLPSHVRGVKQGNAMKGLHKDKGIVPDPDDERLAHGTAQRSTGINWRERNPIDPRMPNLSPS